MEKYDIYFSYIFKVEEYALSLARLLTTEGCTVCLNNDECRKGSSFASLYKRIDECTHFVFFADRSTFGPKYFQSHLELAYAIAKNKRIIPVLLPMFEGVSNDIVSDVAPVRNYHSIQFDKDCPEKSYRNIINMIKNYHDVPETIDNGLSDAVFYDNGSRYYGGMKDGKRNGRGIFFGYVGGRYEGEWKDDMRNGYGKSEDFMDYRYEGEWKDDRYNGFGTLKSADYKYKGEFVNGDPCGRGCIYYADGARLSGTFDDKFTGTGIFYSIDGSRYEGGIVYELLEGQGTCYYPDGSRYEGEWLGGKKHGSGIFYNADGKAEPQQWENGALVDTEKK